MPRLTQDRLVGYTLGVTQRSEPVIDEGQVVHDGKGAVKTRDVWDLVFSDPRSGHRVLIAIDAEGKKAIVSALTGGVVIAKPGDPT